MAPLLAGLGLGLSLIVAIGAQNVFLLRQGVRRERVLALVVLFALSDAVLIVAGVAGLGALIGAVPWFVDVARWVGAAFVAGYGLMAAKRAIRPSGEALDAGEGLDADVADGPATAASAAPDTPSTGGSATAPRGAAVEVAPELVATAAATATGARADAPAPRFAATGLGVIVSGLALTWLNPHVYLDTVVLLGSIAATYGEGRWLFALGAMLGSALWFTALGFGARHLGRWLRSPRAWRILDGVIAVTMLAIAARLAFGA